MDEIIDYEKTISSFPKPLQLPFNNNNIVFQQVTAATVGACITSLFTTPFDVVKNRIQVGGVTSTNLKAYGNSYSSTQTLSTLIRKEGLKSLWRGLPISCFLQVPSSGIYYALYDHLKGKLEYLGPGITPLLSGCISRTVTVTVCSPIEYLRTNIQTSVGNTKILRDFKVQQLARGLVATIWRDVPFSGIYWLTYETFKRRLMLGSKDSNIFLMNFISGAFAGIMAALCTQPFDVIKTRIQARNAKQYNMIEVSKTLLKEDGWKGFTRGLGPRCLKVAPACAIMISTYEVIKTLFQSNYTNN
ncbi:hypothetical protein ABK040_009307 [Willaertia magna]